ncbi:MAG: recombinase family protein [Thiothrix litoralis]|jgi:DNA invertase Pin-like site-specific DNA recombinase
MANYAYLRVSTDQQDVDNQRHGILEYANQNGITGVQFVEDSVSGKVKWRERRIGDLLLKTMQPGDTVIFAEISRMARSTLQVLEMLEHATTTNFHVHVAKQRMRFDDSMNSKITATVLGLAAEIEREFISMRTKEALAKRKADGMTLGRPKGRAETVKLDAHREEIKRYLAKDISKRAIAKLVDCSKSTLYNWLEREGLNKPKPKAAKAPATTP